MLFICLFFRNMRSSFRQRKPRIKKLMESEVNWGEVKITCYSNFHSAAKNVPRNEQKSSYPWKDAWNLAFYSQKKSSNFKPEISSLSSDNVLALKWNDPCQTNFWLFWNQYFLDGILPKIFGFIRGHSERGAGYGYVIFPLFLGLLWIPNEVNYLVGVIFFVCPGDTKQS